MSGVEIGKKARSAALIDQFSGHIRDYGWTACGTYHEQEEGDLPFLYSIGFSQSLKHPEIIIFGLNQATAHTYMQAWYNAIRSGELLLAPGRLPGGFGQYDAFLIKADSVKVREFTPVAEAVLGIEPAYFQVVAPDGQGCFPWDEGFSMFNVPLLGEVAP